MVHIHTKPGLNLLSFSLMADLSSNFSGNFLNDVLDVLEIFTVRFHDYIQLGSCG